MTNSKTYNLIPLDFRKKHTLLGQRENKIGTPFKTYDFETRAVGNNKQKQNAEKAYLDTKVECWALCFCLSPLGASLDRVAD